VRVGRAVLRRRQHRQQGVEQALGGDAVTGQVQRACLLHPRQPGGGVPRAGGARGDVGGAAQRGGGTGQVTGLHLREAQVAHRTHQQVGMRQFQRQRAAVGAVHPPRQPDHAHAAPAQFAQLLVGADALTGRVLGVACRAAQAGRGQEVGGLGLRQLGQHGLQPGPQQLLIRREVGQCCAALGGRQRHQRIQTPREGGPVFGRAGQRGHGGEVGLAWPTSNQALGRTC